MERERCRRRTVSLESINTKKVILCGQQSSQEGRLKARKMKYIIRCRSKKSGISSKIIEKLGIRGSAQNKPKQMNGLFSIIYM